MTYFALVNKFGKRPLIPALYRYSESFASVPEIAEHLLSFTRSGAHREPTVALVAVTYVSILYVKHLTAKRSLEGW